jgi:tetratricopeptide (TPR) repeat protein
MQHIATRILFFALISINPSFGQNVVHTSNHILAVNGTWDLTMDSQRAQFVSGNKNIQSWLTRNFRLTLQRMHRVKSGFVELEFLIKVDSKIDSIKFIKHDDAINDLEALRLLGLTDGAWRTGQIDGERISEKIVIRFYFYDGAEENSPDKNIAKAKGSFENGSFSNCVKYCDKALKINPFEIKALKMKSLALIKQGKSDEACEVFELTKKYYPEYVDELISNSCQ